MKLGQYEGACGIPLHYRQWGGADGGDALIYLHGIESHSEWFAECAEKIERADITVYAPDRRGSGLSEGERGDCREYRQLLEDVIRCVVMVGRSHGRVHAAALSWGAKLAAAAEMLHPGTFCTITLISPGFFPQVMPGVGERLSIAIDSLVRPRSLHPIPIRDDMFTTRQKYLTYIAQDPLRLRRVTARFYLSSVMLDRFLRARRYEWSVPTQVLLAEHDAIVDNDRVRRLFESLNAMPKRLATYEGCSHSLQFENPDRVAHDIVNWVESASEIRRCSNT
jgi:pimeloyl-ACP methyl ester carboxylesterase